MALNDPLDFAQEEDGAPNYQTCGEIAFEVYSQGGAEAVREVFSQCPELTQETCEAAALELEKAGKPSIAAVVRDIAAGCPSEIDLNNPYPPGGLNWHLWRLSWTKKRRLQSGEIERDLRRQADAKPTKARIDGHK